MDSICTDVASPLRCQAAVKALIKNIRIADRDLRFHPARHERDGGIINKESLRILLHLAILGISGHLARLHK
jgi:hypothetical protein